MDFHLVYHVCSMQVCFVIYLPAPKRSNYMLLSLPQHATPYCMFQTEVDISIVRYTHKFCF